MPSRHRTVRKLRADHVGSGMCWCLQETPRSRAASGSLKRGFARALVRCRGTLGFLWRSWELWRALRIFPATWGLLGCPRNYHGGLGGPGGAWEAAGDLEASCRRLQRGPAAWGIRHRVLAASHRTHRRKRPPEDARRPPGNLSGKPNPKTNPIFLLYKTICNKIGLVFGLVFGFGFWISFWICFWILLRRPSRDSFWMKPGAPPGEVFG